jgi:hypothetical protein
MREDRGVAGVRSVRERRWDARIVTVSWSLCSTETMAVCVYLIESYQNQKLISVKLWNGQ